MSISFFASGQDLGNIDSNTSKLPAQNGLARLSFSAEKLYYRKYTGSSYELITAASTYVNPAWITSLANSKITGLFEITLRRTAWGALHC